MRSKAIGALFGFLVCLAAAASAEAQINIQGTKPVCVLDTDSQVGYEATISNASGCNFKLTVLQNGVIKFNPMQYWVSGTSPFTVSHLVTGMSSWGLQVGQEIKFRGKAWTSMSNQKTHDLIRYVEQGGSTYLPSDDRRPTPAGVRGELYAAVLNDDEELLA